MTTTGKRQSPFEAAVEEYLARLDAGYPPDTDEFCAAHAECAEALRAFIDNLEFVDDRLAAAGATGSTVDATAMATDAAPSIEDSAVPGADDAQPSGTPFAKVRGYTLLGKLGGGSQGIIYKAEEPRTKRIVAMKVIREGAFATDLERLRFQNEVELAAGLTHPAIVRVYGSGEDQGRSFFTMEHIDGERLDSHTSRQTLDIERTLQLFLDICDGAIYAHRRGVIHRDLKPSNILIDTEGKPHILDFGLAKRIRDGNETFVRGVTQSGEFTGTWHYASPEQIRGELRTIDVRTDVYTLGVILYEMLTDGYPYPCDSSLPTDIVRHVLDTPPTPPRSIRPELRGDLDTIILRAIHKSVDRRYQSAADLAEDIRRYLGGFPIEAKRDSFWYVAHLAYRRHRFSAIAGAVVIAAMIAFSVTTWVLYKDAKKAQATIKAQSNVGRLNESYLVEKLAELHWKSHALRVVREAYPDLPELLRLNKESHTDSESAFASTVADRPEFVLHAMMHDGCSERPEAVAWLEAHEDDLLQAEQTTRQYRFVFEYLHRRTPEPEGGLHTVNWTTKYEAAYLVTEAFMARALHCHRHGRHEAALSSLEAARSLILDLWDGPHNTLMIAATLMREHLYNTSLIILNAEARHGRSGEPYATWILATPPVGSNRLSLITQRLRLARQFEAATVADGPEAAPYISLDLLSLNRDGWIARSGKLTDENRRWLRDTTPQQVFDAMDALYQTSEEAYDWTLPEYPDGETIEADIGPAGSSNPVRALLRQQLGGFTRHSRHRTARTASLLAAHLCEYRVENGAWPATLADALPAGSEHLLIDPFIAEPYVYRLLDDGPILYSLNEDSVDHGGNAGHWCDPDTDIVFFRPGLPWEPISFYAPQRREMFKTKLTPHIDGENADGSPAPR